MSTQMVVPFPDSLGKQIPEHVFTVVESGIRNDRNTNYLCFVTLQQVEKRVYNAGDGTNIYWGIPQAVTVDKEFGEVLNMLADDNFSVIDFQHRVAKDLSLITMLRIGAVLLHPDQPIVSKKCTWKHKGFSIEQSCDIYHPDFNWDRC